MELGDKQPHGVSRRLFCVLDEWDGVVVCVTLDGFSDHGGTGAVPRAAARRWQRWWVATRSRSGTELVFVRAESRSRITNAVVGSPTQLRLVLTRTTEAKVLRSVSAESKFPRDDRLLQPEALESRDTLRAELRRIASSAFHRPIALTNRCFMSRVPFISIALSCLFGWQILVGQVVAASPEPAAVAKESTVLDRTMKSLQGENVDLSKYKGKTVLVVNVASRCGLTPQYKKLQALHEKYADQGLAILGFPCNQFLQQEPGTSEEIQEFCEKNYGVKFDMFAKVKVNGEDACDLYKALTKVNTQPKKAGKIDWNFEKFVIGRDGQVIARFQPSTEPDDAALVKLLEDSLAKKPTKKPAE